MILLFAFTVEAQTKNYTVNGVTFTMVYVQGSTFTMGCTSEQERECYSFENPVHSVTLSDFWMGETEVTQALWKAVMGSDSSFFKGDNLPVEQVRWSECQVFIKKLNSKLSRKLPSGWRFALPTEAQWEYAARGGVHNSGYKYSGGNNLDDVAWYINNSDAEPHSVKGKKANALGLYDMSGNVYEWCQDWFGDYTDSSQTNPQGPDSGTYRVFRGGGCRCLDVDCRVSVRDSETPDFRLSRLGFRIALVRQ